MSEIKEFISYKEAQKVRAKLAKIFKGKDKNKPLPRVCPMSADVQNSINLYLTMKEKGEI